MYSRGFTLVEVLIATVILFTSIGLATQAYLSSNKSASTAKTSIELLTPLPMLLDNIEASLRDVADTQHSASGVVLGVSYQWQANPIKTFAPKPRFDPDAGEFVTYPTRYVLYEVNLNLKLDNKERDFVFKKLGWLKQQDLKRGAGFDT